MLTLAREVKIQVERCQREVTSYRVTGHENRNIDDKNFRNDRVDVGEVGSGQSVAAMYGVKLVRQSTDK